MMRMAISPRLATRRHVKLIASAFWMAMPRAAGTHGSTAFFAAYLSAAVARVPERATASEREVACDGRRRYTWVAW
jgi:hypothetical protein